MLAFILALLATLPLVKSSPLLPDAQQPFSPPPLPHIEDDRPFPPRPGRAAWYDPRELGGSLLNRNLWGGGEPLNVIISAQSSPDVLRENGFVAYSRSLGMWNECANLHIGDPQEANLGDGKGWERELFVMRQAVRWPWIGACLESVTGGYHFRTYKQNGSEANSGAWWLAASKEVDLRGNHKIAEDGYNRGRDYVVQRAIAGSHYLGRSWEAQVEWVEGLLQPGNDGINHGIPQDGKVAVLTVREY
ncbi:hypothetical protein JCM10213_001184 [Rhodosporidiobolus nylandii]